MKTLSEYISEKLVIIPSQVNEKLVIIPSQVNEKLVINKKFKDDDYELNNILKETWKHIENDKNTKCVQIDSDNVFVEVGGITNEFDIKLSSIGSAAIDAIKSFKRCKHIYLLNSKDYIPLIDALFLKLRKNNIELGQLLYDYSTGFSIEYKETNNFIILVCGDNEDYLTFIGNK